MRLPRDLSGHELIRLLRRWLRTYQAAGRHIRIQSSIRGATHHVTIPDHHSLRIGTLHAILSDVAGYLSIERSTLEQELFDK